MTRSNLIDKVALVTGGSRGIGRAIAERLGRDGAAVAISYVNSKEKAAEVVSAIGKAGSKAIAVQSDVGRTGDIIRLFDHTITHFGKMDILVNSAGIRISKKVVDVSEDDYNRLFDINLKGTFFTCQQAARRMENGGRIINISTTITRLIVPEYSIYTASKAAVDQITRVLAKELGEREITVNAVAPGSIDTDLFREGRTAEQIQQQSRMPVLGRLGEVEDIADVVAFLASDAARWITGQTIHANGGVA
jgi:3-oxoacyl-[acyl-carrier protein] reductase